VQHYLQEARQMQALSFAVHIPLVCFASRCRRWCCSSSGSGFACLIETGNPLVFDVTQATFIDSTVVNAVMRVRSALAARGVPVALVVPDSRRTEYRS
jgi:hypothetical protein